jgi:hypothetical protein
VAADHGALVVRMLKSYPGADGWLGLGASSPSESGISASLLSEEPSPPKPFVAVPSITCGDATHTAIRNEMLERFKNDPLLARFDCSAAESVPGHGALPYGGTWPNPKLARENLAPIAGRPFATSLHPLHRQIAVAMMDLLIRDNLCADLPAINIKLRKFASSCLPSGSKDEPYRHFTFENLAYNAPFITEYLYRNNLDGLLSRYCVMYAYYPVFRGQTSSTVHKTIDGVDRVTWKKSRMVMNGDGSAAIADPYIGRDDAAAGRMRPANGESGSSAPPSRILGVLILDDLMRRFNAFAKGAASKYNLAMRAINATWFKAFDVRNQDSMNLEELGELFIARLAHVAGSLGILAGVSLRAPLISKEPATGEAWIYGSIGDLRQFDTWCLPSGNGLTAAMVHVVCAVLAICALNDRSGDKLLQVANSKGSDGYEGLKKRIAALLSHDPAMVEQSALLFLGGDNFGFAGRADPLKIRTSDDLGSPYVEIPESDSYLGLEDQNQTALEPGVPHLTLSPVKAAMILYPGRDYLDVKRGDSLVGARARELTFSAEGEVCKRAVAAFNAAWYAVMKRKYIEWCDETSRLNPKPKATVAMEPINDAEVKFAETLGDLQYYGDVSRVREAFAAQYFGNLPPSTWHKTAHALLSLPHPKWTTSPSQWGKSRFPTRPGVDYGVLRAAGAGTRGTFKKISSHESRGDRERYTQGEE